MKFNWGTGLALFYAAFAVVMVGAVMASRKYDPGLVQTDYYALDLNYQDRLERKQNATALPLSPAIVNNSADKSMAVKWPEGMENAQGKAKFFRSSTVRDDFYVDFSAEHPLQVSTEKMMPGRWHVEMEWEAGGKKYFWESTFIIA